MIMRGLMILAAALSLAAVAPPPSAPTTWHAFDAAMVQRYRLARPGAVLVLARSDRILIAKGFGHADLEQGGRLGPDSVVRIASLTKQFTAVAVLRLVQDGRLGLDDQLGQRLPDCPVGWREITIRQLLSQTSGLTDDMGPIFGDPMRDRTADELLGPYRDRPLAAPPGTVWRYSNLNYWILGELIERVSGEPYAAYVSRHVLTPAMTRTRYGSHVDLIAGRARGYEGGAGGWTNARYFSPTIGYAAGGFVSTPRDMAVWYAALGRGEIVSPAMLALAGTEAHTKDGRPTGYGLGWYVSIIDGERVLHHGGSSIGFESYVYWRPSDGRFAGVFKNSSDSEGEPTDAARALFELRDR
jgi:CubicO group peptidase (beta-lactamase class C family)